MCGKYSALFELANENLEQRVYTICTELPGLLKKLQSVMIRFCKSKWMTGWIVKRVY